MSELFYTKKHVSDLLSDEEKKVSDAYCEDYKDFLNHAKDEREAVCTAIALAFSFVSALNHFAIYLDANYICMRISYGHNCSVFSCFNGCLDEDPACDLAHRNFDKALIDKRFGCFIVFGSHTFKGLQAELRFARHVAKRSGIHAPNFATPRNSAGKSILVHSAVHRNVHTFQLARCVGFGFGDRKSDSSRLGNSKCRFHVILEKQS